MIKINFFYFFDQETIKIFLKRPKSYNETFYSLKKNIFKCTIVNFSKLLNNYSSNDDFKKKLKKKNIDYFCPSNAEELLKKIKKGNNYGFFKASFDIKYFRLLRIIKQSRVKLIQVSNYSFIFEKKTFEGRTIKQSIRIILKMKLINYFHRLMAAIGFYPKVSIHFDCDQTRIDSINNALSKKINKFIPLLNFSYYKKIVRINSKYYSDFIKLKKNKLEKKYITLCDTPLAHGDFILRDGPYNSLNIENYYKNLNLFLTNIQRALNKKVIICLHPKGEYNTFKNFNLLRKKFKTVYYKTEHYISRSFLVLNIISSTMNFAIMQNKPIIILKSKYLGNTIKGKIDNIIKELNYPVINIDQSKKIDFKKVLNKKNLNKIELYKNKKLFIEKKKTDVQQVIDFLKKDIKTHSCSKNF